LAGLLEDPEQAQKIPGARCVLNGELRTIWEVPTKSDTAYFVHLFRDQRRRVVPRILKTQRRMQALGVPTIEIVALGHETSGVRSREFFIARKIGNSVSLPAGLGHSYEIVPEAREVSERLVESLAQFISDLHRKRFIHGDLKSRHILIQNPPHGREDGDKNADGRSATPSRHSRFSDSRTEDLKFYLVDLEKARSFRFLPETLVDLLRVRDLIQLSASCSQLITNKQKARFLRNYLRRLAVPSARRRIFYYVVRLYSEHDFRQGRTLLENVFAALR
jgi:hypothetical protein